MIKISIPGDALEEGKLEIPQLLEIISAFVLPVNFQS
jgi:hypothetical protein